MRPSAPGVNQHSKAADGGVDELSEGSPSADVVRDLLDRWRAAYVAGESEAVSSLYALDGLLAFAEEVSSYAGRDAVKVAIESRIADACSNGELVFEWGEPVIDGEMVTVEFSDIPGRRDFTGLAIMRIVRGQIVFDRRFRERPKSGGQ